MSRFDESKHVRGGDATNRGRFSTKARCDADPEVGQGLMTRERNFESAAIEYRDMLPLSDRELFDAITNIDNDSSGQFENREQLLEELSRMAPMADSGGYADDARLIASLVASHYNEDAPAQYEGDAASGTFTFETSEGRDPVCTTGVYLGYSEDFSLSRTRPFYKISDDPEGRGFDAAMGYARRMSDDFETLRGRAETSGMLTPVRPLEGARQEVTRAEAAAYITPGARYIQEASDGRGGWTGTNRVTIRHRDWGMNVPVDYEGGGQGGPVLSDSSRFGVDYDNNVIIYRGSEPVARYRAADAPWAR